MSNWSNYYLVRIQFLGFRYHGWQKQPNLITIQGMVEKTLSFVLGHNDFKTLGCGRTDAKVSADDFVFEVFLSQSIDPAPFLRDFNSNLPSDIRAKSVETTHSNFNIIQHPKIKEYHYQFSFGEKPHPYSAPFVWNIDSDLDINMMKQAALCFEGLHNFKRYACKPSASTKLSREVLTSMIEPLLGVDGFMPANTYVYRVRSSGFLRYQVRLMMGALAQVGIGAMTMDELKHTFLDTSAPPMRHIAPSSALKLHKVVL